MSLSKTKQFSQLETVNDDEQHCLLAGDASYKPFVTAEPDMVAMTLEGNEDFLIIGCDGLWDTIGVDEAAFIVLQYLHHESKCPLLFFNAYPTTPGNRLQSLFFNTTLPVKGEEECRGGSLD